MSNLFTDKNDLIDHAFVNESRILEYIDEVVTTLWVDDPYDLKRTGWSRKNSIAYIVIEELATEFENLAQDIQKEYKELELNQLIHGTQPKSFALKYPIENYDFKSIASKWESDIKKSIGRYYGKDKIFGKPYTYVRKADRKNHTMETVQGEPLEPIKQYVNSDGHLVSEYRLSFTKDN